MQNPAVVFCLDIEKTAGVFTSFSIFSLPV